jgi:PiT family inorganic phosphate transporter
LSVYWMTKLKLPVSTSQAIIGAILGWNLFSGSVTDFHSLMRIVFSWAAAIVLTASFSALLYLTIRGVLKRSRIHLLTLDSYTRSGLIVVGAFGAYSLGANNIANVMGVFVPVTPFRDIVVAGMFTLTGVQQLFLLGGIAIAVGVFTYSHRVIQTVGNDLLKISPLAAFVVVLAESLVLFLFSSRTLEGWLLAHGLPTIPLVPISSSQAVIGGIIGIAIVRKGREIRFKVLGDIALGWLATPLLAGVITFFGLFILQNVFNLEVYHRAKPSAVQRAMPPKTGVKKVAEPDVPGKRNRKEMISPPQAGKPSPAPAAAPREADKSDGTLEKGRRGADPGSAAPPGKGNRG